MTPLKDNGRFDGQPGTDLWIGPERANEFIDFFHERILPQQKRYRKTNILVDGYVLRDYVSSVSGGNDGPGR